MDMSSIIPTVVRLKPATKLGQGLLAGLSAATTKAAIVSVIPATMDAQASVRTRMAYSGLAKASTSNRHAIE